ncbi:hemerythrin domain-containing protein [Porphyrobacter sp. ULC335]|jgi:hemerythrin superfamily protein|uniref:hemerythrin domain-containing protein n=1 Tax=Porphyrobacter sp. ULC335 TaxID=2854260 RepID=UPI0022206404|nr:hemerythrin domain-containing protein [Porphyrobacter sp. ULC335]UYV15759.1 hemerythrin domain-containing protein [Porphyrobacter sp. ULC335]
MSFLDRIASALAPAASEEKRMEAREQLEQMAVNEPFAEQILAQHRQIESLFAQARDENGPHAQATIEELALLLNGHAMAEEAVIYPEISDHSSKAHAGMAYEEHAMTKVQLAALQKMQPGTQEWREKLDHIESAVQQHVYQEESSWLPDVIRYAPAEARQRMSLNFREYFDRFERA